MAVKQLRRIGAATAESLYDQIEAQALHSRDWRSSLNELERSHPELILRDGNNVLAAIPRIGVRLVYGFESDRAFCQQFPVMFEKLLPKIRRAVGSGVIRFQLTHAPSRPLIEPVLKQLWFTRSRDWLRFSLARSTRVPASAAPRGVKIRDGGVDDLVELLRIDAECFPATPIDPDALHARIAAGHERVLVAQSGRDVAGFCLYSMPEPGQGYINVLAVAEQHRGTGIGAALTTRAAKRLFTEGAQAVDLQTDDSNGDAIRLYIRLGFKQTRAGRDYTRPIDAKSIETLKAQKQGTLIRFGGWR